MRQVAKRVTSLRFSKHCFSRDHLIGSSSHTRVLCCWLKRNRCDRPTVFESKPVATWRFPPDNIVMQIVDKTEIEDFHQALATSRRSIEDFELIENEQSPENQNGVSALTGTVTITNKRSGRAHSYKAGMGTTWPVDFQDDLLS